MSGCAGRGPPTYEKSTNNKQTTTTTQQKPMLQSMLTLLIIITRIFLLRFTLLFLLLVPSCAAFATISSSPRRCRSDGRALMIPSDEQMDPLLTIIPIERYQNLELPTVFAYPHFYEPHQIAKYASDQVREEIETLSMYRWKQHNFFFSRQSDEEEKSAVGKMFGVLVIRTDYGLLGYLKAYSGTITGVTHSEEYGFCPAIHNRFETCDRTGFSYLTEEAELNKMNRRIEELESNPRRQELCAALDAVKERASISLAHVKLIQKEKKKNRQRRREIMREGLSSPEEILKFKADLARHSAYYQRQVKQVKTATEGDIKHAQAALDEFEMELQDLKQTRREKSIRLQNQLFQQYHFLNINGQRKSLLPLFADTPLLRPPSGAGDCAAPKLFQYAFHRGYIPIALAEFWWGESPLLEVRRHNFFYPACRGKCEPILRHMLLGMKVANNPLDLVGKEVESNKSSLEIVFEDEFIMVVNKPCEMLSVPGRHQEHSVYTIIKESYPSLT